MSATKPRTGVEAANTATELVRNLHQERNPIRVAHVLVEDFGLDRRQLAAACGVAESSVSEWLNGPEDRNPHQRDRVLELAYVVLSALATGSIDPNRLCAWITSPMDYFLGAAPLKAISEGKFLAVSDAAKDFATGRLPA